jgi:WD40 repeat protein
VKEVEALERAFCCKGPVSTAADSLYSLAVASESGLVLAGAFDGKVHAWDLRVGGDVDAQLFSMAGGHTDVVRSVLPVDGERLVVSASSDTSILLWDLRMRKRIAGVSVHSCGVAGLAKCTSSDERLVYSCGRDGKVFALDLSSTGTATLVADIQKSLLSIATSVDGTSLWLGAGDGTVLNWDARMPLTKTAAATGFLADEVLPLEEAPAPQSQKVTTTSAAAAPSTPKELGDSAAPLLPPPLQGLELEQRFT